jgi:hypothetical protein
MSDQKIDVDVLKAMTAGGPMRVITSADNRKSPEEIARMSAAERLDWNRTLDQSKMPDWRDPRKA